MVKRALNPQVGQLGVQLDRTRGPTHLKDQSLQQLGILLLVTSGGSNLCSGVVKDLLEQLLATLEQLKTGLVVLVRDGAVASASCGADEI